MTKRIQIKYWKLGEPPPVFLIAEAGMNYNGNLDLAKQLVIEVKVEFAKAEDLNSIKGNL